MPYASRGRAAEQRAQELLRRESELAAGQAVTEDDVKRARQQAERARERLQETRRRVRNRQYLAGAAHERAAGVEELAVQEDLGDSSAHQLAAKREREAARRDLMAAQEARPRKITN